MPEPRAIVVQIPELWCIQAQYGIFLDYPFDASFERNVFGFDRIVFPTERNPTVLQQLIPVHDIYPTQKSDLEILLDQFFMLNVMQEGSEALEHLVQSGQLTPHTLPGVPEGFDPACFRSAGLPRDDSWAASRLTEWLLPAKETWTPISAARTIAVKYPTGQSCSDRILALKRQLDELMAANPALARHPSDGSCSTYMAMRPAPFAR